MTALISTDIGCDYCDAVLPGVKYGTRIESTKARNIAIMCGWKIRQRQDICPECAKEMASGKA